MVNITESDTFYRLKNFHLNGIRATRRVPNPDVSQAEMFLDVVAGQMPLNFRSAKPLIVHLVEDKKLSPDELDEIRKRLSLLKTSSSLQMLNLRA